MKVSLVMGSRSDEKIGKEVIETLDQFGIDHEFKILSAHRNRKELEEYVSKSDADVFIAIAGLSAHLPGAIASMTTKPVIGVPRSASLMGIDALLSMVQMPKGIPVATVGIDNGRNAALLAIEILSIKDDSLKDGLKLYREEWRK